MIEDVLPDIPRLYTAIAEWGACLVYVLLIRKRLPRPQLALAAGLGLGALIGVQLLAGTLPIALWVVGMALAVGTMYLLIAACADLTALNAGYFLARAFVLAELVASLHWQLHTFFFDAGDDLSVLPGALLVVVYGAAFTAAWAIERRHFPADQPVDVDGRGVLSAMAIAAITFLISNLSFLSTNTPFSGRLGPEVFYIRTLVDLAGYVALYAQQGQRLELRRTAEVEAMNRLLHSQHEQYLQARNNIDVVNRKYHDLKHYINAIRGEASADARASYLDQLEDSIRDYDTRVETGNIVLDTIMTTKSADCARHGITLTCVADGAALDFMAAMDVAALVGNALDNAIEAAVALPDPEQRLLRVAVHRQDSFVMLRFENYYQGDLMFDGDLPRTTKAGDDLNHGYGLRNIRQIAERYGGTLTVHAEDGWFTVRVLVPAPGPTGTDVS
ncbi:GHKL domain-containing protein [Cellulomonas bogoriensis]|uniref:Histidine kinase n=1 Tax=Cellulomonas bogoriensis 69B4 = DSM 16987 TaxID=1386082 RepID=A0A0A0BZZ2_9CELL|nr:GHKL domain-containing protein [Cellulomonas bogoriensis]KGM13983.1 histidine kinase [Cellulomonas bogoriensis 69B4 = DSM 16987]